MYNLTSYLKFQYQKALEKARDFFSFSGLEQLAVVGVSNNLVKSELRPRLQNPLDYVFHNSKVGDYRVQDGNVIVRRSDGRKEVALHPRSVAHDSEGYTKKALTDAGMTPSTSDVKKIAKEVERLRPKK